MALRFAPDGTLYGATPSTLYEIDWKTGLASNPVGFSSNVAGNVIGLAIDSGEKFYVADFVPQSHIYRLNVNTGEATAILNTGLNYVHNIAFRVPF